MPICALDGFRFLVRPDRLKEIDRSSGLVVAGLDDQLNRSHFTSCGRLPGVAEASTREGYAAPNVISGVCRTSLKTLSVAAI